MRNIARLGIKLLGIFFLYRAVMNFADVAGGYPVYTFHAQGAHTLSEQLAVRRASGIYIADLFRGTLLTAFTVFLLRCTDWIADKMKFPDGAVPEVSATPLEILRTFLIVIGIYALVQGTPAVFDAVGLLISARSFHLTGAQESLGEVMQWDSFSLGLSNLIGGAVKTTSGLFLVIKSRAIATRLLR